MPKTEVSNLKFKVKYIHWKVHFVIRLGESVEFWEFVFKFPDNQIEIVRVFIDPFTNNTMPALFKKKGSVHPDYFGFSGKLQPKDKFKLNPLKSGEVSVDNIDSGIAQKVSDSNTFWRYIIKGEKLKSKIAIFQRSGSKVGTFSYTQSPLTATGQEEEK